MQMPYPRVAKEFAILKKKKTRNLLRIIVLVELLCVAAELFAVNYIYIRDLTESRGDALTASIAGFDTAPLATYAGDSLRKAREQIVEELDETVWTTDSVNYRTGPGTSYDSAGQLYKYASARRTGTTYNKWSRVVINDEEYYIYSDYLTTETPIILDGGQKGQYEAYAMSLFPNYGWADSEILPLIRLWNRESGWNPNSHNRSSGAHGIPQALPASKMASQGSDYYTNGYTQIRWGLGYIYGRYGSPSRAWGHLSSSGWY